MAVSGNIDMQISVLYIPNQPLIRSKELGDRIYDGFGYFWKTGEYNEIGSLGGCS